MTPFVSVVLSKGVFYSCIPTSWRVSSYHRNVTHSKFVQDCVPDESNTIQHYMIWCDMIWCDVMWCVKDTILYSCLLFNELLSHLKAFKASNSLHQEFLKCLCWIWMKPPFENQAEGHMFPALPCSSLLILLMFFFSQSDQQTGVSLLHKYNLSAIYLYPKRVTKAWQLQFLTSLRALLHTQTFDGEMCTSCDVARVKNAAFPLLHVNESTCRT